MTLNPSDIVRHFPISAPYKFIDELLEISAAHVTGTYTFKQEEYFFSGHFPGNPVVPGAILLEAAAQIGMLPMGIYMLLKERKLSFTDLQHTAGNTTVSELFYLVSADLVFKKIIRPGEKIVVYAEKEFYRLQKLKCNIRIETENQELVCRGTIAGLVNIENLIV